MWLLLEKEDFEEKHVPPHLISCPVLLEPDASHFWRICHGSICYVVITSIGKNMNGDLLLVRKAPAVLACFVVK